MQFKSFLGIDISKSTIDFALKNNKEKENNSLLTKQFSNNLSGYKAMLTWLEKQDVNLERTLVCLENTGIYHRSLVAFLSSKKAFVWVENPMAIKRSMGIQRGKSDQMDAKRICLYAFRYQDIARNFDKLDDNLQRLSDLLAARSRLIEAKKSICMPIQEFKATGLKETADLLEKAHSTTLTSITKEINIIEKCMQAIVKKESRLQRNYECAISVPGLGFITVINFLVYTRNFNRFKSAKQLASYSGIAPFPYSSGSSVRGRNRVHPLANKKLKTALHMSALTAIRCNQETKIYFERKLGEGKNKMSIINAVRNKQLYKMFACVRDNRLYEDKLLAA